MITRRGEKPYCYRYERTGSKVRRVYVAAGKAALEAQAQLDEARRLLKEERELALQDERRRALALGPLEQLSRLIDELVKATLIQRGFQLHARSVWRLKRR
jgi:hypothetical protein